MAKPPRKSRRRKRSKNLVPSWWFPVPQKTFQDYYSLFALCKAKPPRERIWNKRIERAKPSFLNSPEWNWKAYPLDAREIENALAIPSFSKGKNEAEGILGSQLRKHQAFLDFLMQSFLRLHKESPYVLFGGKAWSLYGSRQHSFDYDMLIDFSNASGEKFWEDLQFFCVHWVLPLAQTWISKDVFLERTYIAKHATHRFFLVWGILRVCLLDVHLQKPCEEDRVMLKFTEERGLHLQMLHLLRQDAKRLIRESMTALLNIQKFELYWNRQVECGNITGAQLFDEAYQGILYRFYDNAERRLQLQSRIRKNQERLRWCDYRMMQDFCL